MTSEAKPRSRRRLPRWRLLASPLTRRILAVNLLAPIVRGRKKFLKNADAFALFALYGLANPDDLRVSLPGYEGLARVPLDLSFDVGFRLDMQIGVFQFGLAKLGWLFVQ